MLSAAVRDKAFWAVFAAALALRVFRLDLPFVEPYNSLSRQAIVASVARNFYEHGFNFFYPEIDENGRGPYLYNAEMPVYSYLMAAGYRLAGGVREWAARAVSVTFSMGTILFLYLAVRRTDGAFAAAAAAAFAACSPLNLAISRSIQPDATMLFACSAAFYFLLRYAEEGGLAVWTASACFTALALATRIQMLPLLAPPIVYALHRRRDFPFRPAVGIAAAGGLLALLWYAAMWNAGRTQALAYSPYDYLHSRGPQGVSMLAAFSAPYALQIGRTFLLHVMTPIGVVLAASGLAAKTADGRRAHPAAWAWLAGLGLYAIVFWRFIIDHAYYQAPMVPVLALFVGRGAASWRERFRSGARWVAPAAFALALVSAAGAAYLARGLYVLTPQVLAIVEAGRQADARLPQDALVVANYGTSTIQLYYCHRKGWAMDINRPGHERELIDELENRRREGAAYFVTGYKPHLQGVPEFERHLRGHYAVVSETERYALFDLNRSAGP